MFNFASIVNCCNVFDVVDGLWNEQTENVLKAHVDVMLAQLEYLVAQNDRRTAMQAPQAADRIVR